MSQAPGHDTASVVDGTSRPARSGDGGGAEVTGAGWRHRLGAYVALTKPRVIELLLVTTIPTMILAQGGFPSWWLVVATLVGGALAAGSANVLNCYLDRDIDQVMNRTRRRATATGEISPRAALLFGLGLGVVSMAWFVAFVNVASALLAVGAILLYVVGYTMILKRRTPQNIVWGGIAGCMPVLIGWSAVTGGVSWAPVALFGVVFFWTPPHYWPLSMKFRRDYANAGVPMLPVVAKDDRVAREMVWYTVAMIVCSLLLVPLAHMTWVYAVVALALGVWFLALCVQMLRRAEHNNEAGAQKAKLYEMKVFHASITYLTLLSVAVCVDVFLPW
ncbi:heme o synthase [Luteimicrobium subarcticum]|uniref:Protoheme IX farnesyltransferase n=1 Tax=Luteimicrobium subarcticum TaxID=620910 RepID=A0A2M8W3C0_9MICO|nr:heme o synthase [Luteimicrobium subarcticum]PJI85423.1 protoheme IX farnesyltransferase [Luteimicrobium subarcticum]